MNNLETEIVDLYDNNDMSVADIASELNGEIDATAIKYVLSQHSEKFRKLTVDNAKKAPATVIDVKSETTPVPVLVSTSSNNTDMFTDADKKEIVRVMKYLMNHSENDMVRARTAIYLHEEATGRNAKRVEKNNGIPNVRANILMINAQIQKGRSLVDNALKSIGQSPMLLVDVK